MTLPEPGVAWTQNERLNWLTMANSIFKMIYKSNDTDAGDVTIKIEKT